MIGIYLLSDHSVFLWIYTKVGTSARQRFSKGH